MFGFSLGKNKQTTDYWTDKQKQGANKIGDYLTGQVGKGVPKYQGDRVAGMSDLEKRGMNLAGQYAESGTPQQYGWASDSLQKALTGNYKPIVDPAATERLYGSIKDRTMNIDLPQLQDSIAKNANLSGMYYSGGHGKSQSDAVGDVATRLAETLAQLKYQDEQDRRNIAREREARSFSAIPSALTVGNVIQGDKFNKAQAALGAGSLPRSLQQADLDAKYQEFMRTSPQNNPALAQMLQYLNTRGKATTTGQNSGFNFDLGKAGPTMSGLAEGVFDVGSLMKYWPF